MPNIAAVSRENASPKSRQLLDGVQKALGATPNMMATMAVSPALLDGYLSLNAALGRGTLDPRTRERLALAVAQANGCDYCLAAHAFLGGRAGLTPAQVADARAGDADEPKVRAALHLAQDLVRSRGRVSLATARGAGLTEEEIAEVVGHVALNVLTNYFNLTAGTEVDFPAVPALDLAPAAA